MTTVNVTPASNLPSVISGGGTTLLFAPGVYRGQTLSSPGVSNLQFIGDPNGGTIINGSVIVSGWNMTVSSNSTYQGIWTSNIQFTRIQPFTDQSMVPNASSLAVFNEELFRDNNRLIPTSSNPPASGQWFWNNGNIMVADDPTGHLMELAQLQNFFTGGNGISGELMQDITVEKYATPGGNSIFATVIGSVNSRFIRCTFQKNHSTGFTTFGANVALQNCKILENGQQGYGFGFGGSNVAGCSITGSEIARNFNANFSLNNTGGGGKVFSGTYVFERNYYHHNYGGGGSGAPGLWNDGYCYLTNMRNNLFVENYGPGIMHEICNTSTIQYNVFARNSLNNNNNFNGAYSCNILISNSDHNIIDRNYIETGNTIGSAIMLVEDNTRAGSNTSNNIVSNNIVVFGDTTIGLHGFYNYGGTSGATGNTFTETFQFNTYITKNINDPHFTWWNASTGALAAGRNTFANWKALHGLDTTSTLIANTWPNMVVLVGSNNYTDLINTTNAPRALYGGNYDETFDPGPYAYPAHIWLGTGNNSLIIRQGTANTVVHDWIKGGGNNTLYLIGYSFANSSSVIASTVVGGTGSDAVLQLTDGYNVTFVDTSNAVFQTSNVFVTLAAPTIPQSQQALLATESYLGGVAGGVGTNFLSTIIGSAMSQRTGIPVDGTYTAGTFLRNTSAKVLGVNNQQYIILGWYCIAGGTPGVWVAIQGPIVPTVPTGI